MADLYIPPALKIEPTSLMPKWAGQFDTFAQWVNSAPQRLSHARDSNGYPMAAICVDALGRRCHNGRDFARARDENAFPVRYFWECEPAQPDWFMDARDPEDGEHSEEALVDKTGESSVVMEIDTAMVLPRYWMAATYHEPGGWKITRHKTKEEADAACDERMVATPDTTEEN